MKSHHFPVGILGTGLYYLWFSSFNSVRNFSNKSAVVTNIKRKYYLRLYPTRVVQPDGSTHTIRFEEPRRIIKFPVDLSALSSEEKLAILNNRRPKTKVIIDEEENINFNHQQYLNILKRGRKL